jgi:hypothetical protein
LAKQVPPDPGAGSILAGCPPAEPNRSIAGRPQVSTQPSMPIGRPSVSVICSALPAHAYPAICHCTRLRETSDPAEARMVVAVPSAPADSR